jgi:hypothetical protein
MIGSIETLEARIVLSVDLLASAIDPVSFATAEQSMWGPDGSGVKDTGLLFTGPSWNTSANPMLGTLASNNYIQLNASTSGRIGVDFRAILDPGSIDASFASQVGLEVIAGATDDAFTILSQSLGDPVGDLVTRSPNIDVESNFVFELAAALGINGAIGTPDVTITVPTVTWKEQCVDLGWFGIACTQVPVFGTTQVTIHGANFPFELQLVDFDIAGKLQLLKVTNQQISILQQDLAVAEPGENLSFNFDIAYSPATGVEIEVIDEDNPKKDEKPHDTNPFDIGVSFSMGDVTIEVPTLNLEQNQFSTQGGKKGLRTAGATNLARVDIDADFLASVFFGLPPLGASVDFALGPVDLFGFSYDLLDVDIGPQFSIGQSFEFLPELWVDLAFSAPVTIGGQQVMQHSMPVGSSLDATFDGAVTGAALGIETQYVLRNQFRNKTELLVAPQVDVLALGLEVDTFLGTLFSGALYDPPPIVLGAPTTLATIFNDTYTLGGFDPVAGQSLNVLFNRPPVIEPGDLVFDAAVGEGGPLSLTGTFSESNPGQTHTVHIDWGDGTEPTVLELAADVFSFGPVEHIYADGPAEHTISVTVTDDKGESDDAQAGVAILNVAPTALLSGDEITYGQTATVSFSQQFDPSTPDTEAGFRYAYVLDAGALESVTYQTGSTAEEFWSLEELDAGTYTVFARIIDKDDGFTQYQTIVEVAKADQLIEWSAPAAILHGTLLDDEQLNAAVSGVPGGTAPGQLVYDPPAGTVLDIGTQTLAVTAVETNNYNAAVLEVELDVLKPYSLSGFVFVDFNNDGEINFGEQGIAGVVLTLTGLDDLGSAVVLADETDADGSFYFGNLRPGAYHITQSQPDGYHQGINSIGTLGGELEDVDRFFVELPYADALVPEAQTAGTNYNFGERPMADGEIGSNQTAGIGFWNNKHGQALIRSLNGSEDSTQLGDWLAATFVNLYGEHAGDHDLTGKSNAQVAAFFRTLFAVRGQKVEAQVLATALAVYATNFTLAGDAAEAYGFHVTTYGVGNTTFNVGTSGAAFGLDDHAEATILDLLLATDSFAKNGILYDNGDAKLMKSLRNLANQVYSDINEKGR